MRFIKPRTFLKGAFFLAIMGLHYLVFVREFVSKKSMIWGDTHCHWSLKYMMLYSLKFFKELPWWDPTMYNGYPLYYHFLSGWSNYLSPYYVPSLIIFKLLSLTYKFTINNAVLFHEAFYVILLIAVALYLISKELVSRTLAAFLPVFIFCFSYFPLLNYHDFYSHEAMIAPLFYIYALLKFNNKRTPKTLLLLLFFTGLLLASLCNGIMMSAFFWTTIFTFLVLICNISLVKDAFFILGRFLKFWRGRILIFLVFLIIITGFAAAYLPVHYNVGEVIKYRGGRVDYFSSGSFTNKPIDIEKSKIWTVLSNWLPFPQFQEERLDYGWDGHDHRYIGILTIPLILIALVCLSNRYVIPLLLTYCVCNTFIIYSTDNIVYRILIDNVDFFRNVRNITSIFSRGGGLLFLILLSGVGLDILLKRGDSLLAPVSKCQQVLRQKRRTASMFVCLFLIALGIVLVAYQSSLSVYETTFHIGWYLILFSGMCLGLLLNKNKAISRGIVVGMFVLVFLDLTISSSAYIDTYARVPWDESRAIPDSVQFKPIKHEHEGMFPSGYKGTYHNTKGVIQWGKKEWLVLATTNNGQRILENWNPESKSMREYPAFRFIDKANFLPLERIASIQSDSAITDYSPMLYINDKEFGQIHDTKDMPVSIGGRYEIQNYTFNKITIKTDTSRDGYLYFLDNYDRFWSAYLNEKRTKIYRANFAFKAIELPKGINTVDWVYDPYPVRYAYIMFYSLIGIFVVCYFLFSRFQKAKLFYSEYA